MKPLSSLESNMDHILQSLKDTPPLSAVQVVYNDVYTMFSLMLGSKKTIFVKIITKKKKINLKKVYEFFGTLKKLPIKSLEESRSFYQILLKLTS